MHRVLFRCLLCACLACSAPILFAQARPEAPLRITAELGGIVRQSGMIFAGRVVSIQPDGLGAPDRTARVQITVQVEQGVRGATAGQRLTFREWGGLWAGGERYRVGQRVMLFLYPPSALGLTSPVGGPAGRYEIDRSGRVRVTAPQGTIRVHPDSDASGVSRMIPIREFARALRRVAEE
jgi:hypothetical protein